MVAMTTAMTGPADQLAQHDPLEGEAEARPSRPARPRWTRHSGAPAGAPSSRGHHEAGDHHELALGEVDGVGGLVDEHEAQRDQRVHQADEHAVGQQQERRSAELIRHGRGPPPRPRCGRAERIVALAAVLVGDGRGELHLARAAVEGVDRPARTSRPRSGAGPCGCGSSRRRRRRGPWSGGGSAGSAVASGSVSLPRRISSRMRRADLGLLAQVRVGGVGDARAARPSCPPCSRSMAIIAVDERALVAEGAPPPGCRG